METSHPVTNNGILSTEGITVAFGGLTALKDVSVMVKEGEIRGIIGPNGAGKTTFFNAVTRFVPITSGAVRFRGENITALPAHAVAKKGVIRTFQKRGIIASLTALENVLTGCHRMMDEMTLLDICLRTARFKKIEGEGLAGANRALEAVGLPYAADKVAGELSFGEQTLIEIARALVSRPQLLLLDEPAAGLSSAERDNLAQILKSLPSTQGVTIMVTDHIMDFLMHMCDNLTVLNFGEVLEEGDVEYIRHHPGVLEAYFGRG
jgi:ABC-type branched-subunit amino acid transport system ATPase component